MRKSIAYPFVITGVVLAASAAIGVGLGILASMTIPSDLFDVDITPEELP